MNKLLLRLINSFAPVLERSGVDTYQLHQILKFKLLIDNRRPVNLMAHTKRVTKKAPSGKASSAWGTYLVVGLLGLVLSFMLFTFKKPLVGQTVYFSAFMVMLAMTMITDFTSVLLDVRDQYIILPRPVNDRTLTVSRILHIGIYVSKLALAMGAAGVIMVGFADNWAAVPVFLVQIMEATFVSVLLVNIIYLVLLKMVSPHKFKDIISYFQIGFSVIIFGTYYLLPRLINMATLESFDLLQHDWAYALPPAWIAALNEVLIHAGRSTVFTSLLAIAGVVAPLAGIWLVAKVLAPGFNSKLAVVATSDASTTVTTVKEEKPRFNLVNRIANLIAPDPVENAGFRITWKLAARLREFKIKVYPAFAYVPIYFVYFAFNTKGANLNDKYEALRHGQKYILLIYLSTFVISSILQNISYSEKFKASWVYYALPIQYPGKILSGMYKAVSTLYYLPYCLVLGVISVLVWGPSVINDVILSTFVGLIYGLLTALFLLKGLPFSKPVLIKQSGGRFVTAMLIAAFIGIIGLGHYFLSRWETVIWILTIPAAGIYWLMLHYYKKQTWEAIEMEEL
jgi:ABC-2 type transport system permease protein